MIDSLTIQRDAESAARRAKKTGKRPYTFSLAERERLAAGSIEPLARIPFLGSYASRDWQVAQRFFVDSSGFGAEGEPALTIGAFCKQVIAAPADAAWAIVARGQFQIYIDRYRPVK